MPDTLNRSKVLNTLGRQGARELLHAVRAADGTSQIGAIVITGSAKAFAVGADIKEMQTQDFAAMYHADWFAKWDDLSRTRKPTIAAVAGYVLGGGCELALMCDMILTADTARLVNPK